MNAAVHQHEYFTNNVCIVCFNSKDHTSDTKDIKE